MRRRSAKPQLITDAPRSVESELRYREIRYVIMMSLRALCIVVAAVLAALRVPLLPLWLLLCVAGAVVLPWTAVLLANDRLARPERRHRNQPVAPTPTRVLDDAGTVPPEHKVIDLEP